MCFAIIKNGCIINYIALHLKGIHPHDAKSYTDESWEELRRLAENPECVAVGECGLDYNRNFSEPEDQRMVFRKHVSNL